MKVPLSLLFAFSALVVCGANEVPFSYYETIVDRQMFGAPPANFDPEKMPSEVAKTKAAEMTKEQERVMKAIRFSVLNVTPSGEVAVGFTDSGDPKNPLHYYLKVGEEQNGWRVKAADKDAATMTIEKEGIEVTLKLGSDSASDPSSVNRTKDVKMPLHQASPVASARQSLREKRAERERVRDEQAKVEKAKAAEDRAAMLEQLNQMRNELQAVRQLNETQESKSAEHAGAQEN